ncbi:MAG: hypothetical protein ABI186_00740 [Candidatus Elarobacter sp.]
MQRIHGLIDEAARISTFERIVFTGGECFLLGRELDGLIAHAHGLGFDTRAISNGYWATTDRAALARVTALRVAGLDEMMLSTGRFHQRFVPVERIAHAARATARAGILTRITIEDCDQSEFDDAWLRAELADALDDGTLAISHDPWITDAGARSETRVTHDRLRAAGSARPGGGCIKVLTTLSVTPDQELIACCGFPLEELPGLRIGSVAETPLDQVIRDAPNDLLKMFLHVAGPMGIADFVARYEPGYTLPGDPVSICDACIALQRDTRAMRVAAAHAEEIASTIVASFVESQTSFALPRARHHHTTTEA